LAFKIREYSRNNINHDECQKEYKTPSI
jgi:hypothetical protein